MEEPNYLTILKMSAQEMLARVREGEVVLEKDSYFLLEYYRVRELVPITDHIPHGVRAAIRKNRFSYSTNQQFGLIARRCAGPRIKKDGTCAGTWIGPRLRTMLEELHEKGSAHSVEVYKDGDLVGGLIGVSAGAMFSGFSLFSFYSGAGNAAFAAVQRILHAEKFELHDALQVSKTSRLFGGIQATEGQFDLLRRAALEIEPRFPTLDQRPFEMYFPAHPTQQSARPHGRPFPR